MSASRNSSVTAPALAERHRAVEARTPSGVAGARPLLLDLEPYRVLIAIDPHLDDALDVAGGLALLPERLARAAVVPGLARRRWSCAALRHSCARPSAGRPIWHRSRPQVMSPSASNLGLNARPSSMSCADEAKDGSCVPPSAARASGRRRDFNKRDCELPLRAAQHRHETHLLAGIVAKRAA